MKKAVVFGASGTGMLLYPTLKSKYDIIYATDNDSIYYNKTIWDGVLVKNKESLCNQDYDCVIIARATPHKPAPTALSKHSFFKNA